MASSAQESGAWRDAWWRSGVLYQIYPRSFADTNGDGQGDLQGVIDHLDHLAWLGIDGIWLSPITPSPNAEWGYDVTDYTTVGGSRLGGAAGTNEGSGPPWWRC